MGMVTEKVTGHHEGRDYSVLRMKHSKFVLEDHPFTEEGEDGIKRFIEYNKYLKYKNKPPVRPEFFFFETGIDWKDKLNTYHRDKKKKFVVPPESLTEKDFTNIGHFTAPCLICDRKCEPGKYCPYIKLVKAYNNYCKKTGKGEITEHWKHRWYKDVKGNKIKFCVKKNKGEILRIRVD